MVLFYPEYFTRSRCHLTVSGALLYFCYRKPLITGPMGISGAPAGCFYEILGIGVCHAYPVSGFFSIGA